MASSPRLFFSFRLMASSLLCLLAWAPSTCAAQPGPQMPPVLLQMIRDESIHRELQLSGDQRAQVIRLLKSVDGPWFRSRNLAAEQQRQEIERLTAGLQTELAGVLEGGQASRLRQLERQALGTRMVLLSDVADALELTTSQRDTFRGAFLETDKKAQDIQKRMQSGEKSSEDASEELSRLKAKERQSLAGALTNDQKSKLGGLTGNPFDFAKIRRTYPLAPELTTAGVTWIQGGPLAIEELRGKVIAVHFYAFQCINCQRNFPHYKAWYDDYADRDFVVIGIQTPETASERKLERVASAAKSDGMDYPIVMDAEASNWRAWSNTMWPTVYLIDKKGFIRRWWQGELNWKGTAGEQQMRNTIEQLLAEDS